MNQEIKYYKHSGTVGLMGPIYMAIFGILGAVILGFIYGYAIFYIPFIYFNFFITLFFGAAVGFLVSIAGKWGKVRNLAVFFLFGLLFGILAEYVGWVSWIYAFSKQEFLILPPSDLFSVVKAVAQEGAWSMFGSTPTGLTLYAIWTLEAIMIIGISTFVAFGLLKSTPFCEHCDLWIDKEDSTSPLELVTDPDDFKAKLEQDDFTPLKELKKIEITANTYTKLDLLRCPACQQSCFLTVKSVAVTKDKKGKETKEEKEIMQNLIISFKNYEMLRQQWQSLNSERTNEVT